jgi:uncharacterized protein
MTPTVIAFLKAPRPGGVKTRLARDFGVAAATGIYRALAGEQWHRIPPEWRAEVHFAPADAEAEMRGWLGPRGVFRPQVEGDLGARLIAGFAQAFAAGGAPVIAIGGDCPGLDSACLEAARAALQDVDVVLGPAVDGGYYLIGLNRPAPVLFSGIPWSTSRVLATTLARTEAAGLRCHLLETKLDIDDAASWERHQAAGVECRGAATPPAAEGNDKTNTPLPGGLTIIIPALNEAAGIADAVRAAGAALPGARRVVVDGGSADATVALAAAAGAEVVVSARGRGVQLAAGAAVAATDWLLFLHADTLLPSEAEQVMAEFAGEPDARVATFRLRFDAGGWFLRTCQWFSRFDSVFTRFGDQGILIRRDFYRAIGGFDPWPLFEDVALLRRARRAARIRSLPAAVTTSARRFEARGHVRQQWLNARLLLRYLAGTPPEQLAREYTMRRPRPEPPPGAVTPLHETERSKR